MIRTFLILAALVASGIGFARLTNKGVAVTGMPDAGLSPTWERDRISAKVYLTISHIPEFHALKVSEQDVQLSRGSSGVFAGTVLIDPENPVAFLKVSSVAKAPNDGQRIFAKLVVEAEGEETFTHVFDAEGEIDDFVELPF